MPPRRLGDICLQCALDGVACQIIRAIEQPEVQQGLGLLQPGRWQGTMPTVAIPVSPGVRRQWPHRQTTACRVPTARQISAVQVDSSGPLPTSPCVLSAETTSRCRSAKPAQAAARARSPGCNAGLGLRLCPSVANADRQAMLRTARGMSANVKTRNARVSDPVAPDGESGRTLSEPARVRPA